MGIYIWQLDKDSGVHSASVGKREAKVKLAFSFGDVADVYVITLAEGEEKGELIAPSLGMATDQAEEFLGSGDDFDFGKCSLIGHTERCLAVQAFQKK